MDKQNIGIASPAFAPKFGVVLVQNSQPKVIESELPNTDCLMPTLV